MKKTRPLYMFLIVIAPVLSVFAVGAFAGDPKPTASPTEGIMHMLDEIYNKLDSIASIALLAPVEKTGQTTSYATGDDGDRGKGAAWPVPRFMDNDNGTVTDNLTGLIWLHNAKCLGAVTWSQALTVCNALNDGECGLTDGSSEGDWRLPNVKELQSLIDFGNYDPALPSGHPFSGVRSNYCWSSTTFADCPDFAWSVNLNNGAVSFGNKSGSFYVWPVRGGQ